MTTLAECLRLYGGAEHSWQGIQVRRNPDGRHDETSPLMCATSHHVAWDILRAGMAAVGLDDGNWLPRNYGVLADPFVTQLDKEVRGEKTA